MLHFQLLAKHQKKKKKHKKAKQTLKTLKLKNNLNFKLKLTPHSDTLTAVGTHR
jgi:hypothetical protein